MDKLQNKTPPRKRERNKESCEAGEPPVVIPIVVVAVDVHLALVVVPAVECGYNVQNASRYHYPLNTLGVEPNLAL